MFDATATGGGGAVLALSHLSTAPTPAVRSVMRPSGMFPSDQECVVAAENGARKSRFIKALASLRTGPDSASGSRARHREGLPEAQHALHKAGWPNYSTFVGDDFVVTDLDTATSFRREPGSRACTIALGTSVKRRSSTSQRSRSSSWTVALPTSAECTSPSMPEPPLHSCGKRSTERSLSDCCCRDGSPTS